MEVLGTAAESAKLRPAFESGPIRCQRASPPRSGAFVGCSSYKVRYDLTAKIKQEYSLYYQHGRIKVAEAGTCRLFDPGPIQLPSGAAALGMTAAEAIVFVAVNGSCHPMIQHGPHGRLKISLRMLGEAACRAQMHFPALNTE